MPGNHSVHELCPTHQTMSFVVLQKVICCCCIRLAQTVPSLGLMTAQAHVVLCLCNRAVNVLIDRVSAYDMSAQHISELRRERVNDPNISLLAKAVQAAGETFRYWSDHAGHTALSCAAQGIHCNCRLTPSMQLPLAYAIPKV